MSPLALDKAEMIEEKRVRFNESKAAKAQRRYKERRSCVDNNGPASIINERNAVIGSTERSGVLNLE